MDVLRKFKFRNSYWHCAVTFYSDYVEYSWDYFGKGVERGNRATAREELSPYLSESVGPASSHYATSFRLAGLYFALTIFSNALLAYPWRYFMFLFLVMFLLAAYRGLYHFRKKNWIRIMMKNGGVAIYIEATKWTIQERDEFRHFYTEWYANYAPWTNR